MPELVEEVVSENDENKEWDDWHADADEVEEATPTLCVACESVFASSEQCLAHIKEAHGFDFLAFLKASTSDPSLRMYHHIKLVNYLRHHYGVSSSEASKVKDSSTVAKQVKVEGEEWNSEKYLKSKIEDDPLLYIDADDEDGQDEDDAPFKLPSEAAPSKPGYQFKDLSREALEAKLASALEEQAAASEKLAYLEQHLASLQRLNKTLLDEPEPRSRSGSVSSDSSESSVVKEIDAGYFGSYAGFHIHEDMIKDRVRTDAYRDFIEGNPELFKDKIVMDVGCGTSILSMFAVRAGAKHVIAIDNSGIIERAKEIAKENGFENKITFIRNKAEQIEELAGVCDKVDIIISEWMGYCLLFESMLPSVLFVRDRWLRPGTGRVYPDVSSLHLVGMSAPGYRKARVDFWKKDVYGFTMNSIASRVHLEPGVDHMQDYEVITDAQKFFEIDCNKVKAEQLDFESEFTLTSSKASTLDALVTYFDIGFIKDASKPITFTTSPSATETHWRQTVLILKDPVVLNQGSKITGKIQLKANRQSFRDLDILLHYQIDNGPVITQTFGLC